MRFSGKNTVCKFDVVGLILVVFLLIVVSFFVSFSDAATLSRKAVERLLLDERLTEAVALYKSHKYLSASYLFWKYKFDEITCG